MYAQIMLDCQTRTEYVSCEYCIAKESCHLRLKLGEQIVNGSEPSKSAVPILLLRTIPGETVFQTA